MRAELATELKRFGMPADDAEKIARWDPYDQNATTDWFDSEWMFGITDGFDVVLAIRLTLSYTNRSLPDGKQLKSPYQYHYPVMSRDLHR